MGQPLLVLRRDPGPGHGADCKRFGVDGRPACKVSADSGVDHANSGGMQVNDTKSLSGQCRNVSASTVRPLFPHKEIVPSLAPSGIPRILGSTRSAGQPSVADMTHLVQHSAAGDGIELTAPDAVLTVKIDAAHTDDQYELFEVDAPRGPATPLHRTGWAKAYYVLNGRMIVQVEDEAFDLGPGSSITIPPGALHTFTVLSPSTKFLALSLTGAMGRFHADLDATIPRDRPVGEIMHEIQQVLGRHDVAVAGFDAAGLEPVS
jgi:quercetin dioxygenase-like cupin family protein